MRTTGSTDLTALLRAWSAGDAQAAPAACWSITPAGIRASKRGSWSHTISLEDGEQVSVSPAQDLDILELNDALVELSAVDPLRARMIELRFFGGLTTDETAEALAVSSATVTRGWRLARAWLHHRLTHGSPPVETREQRTHDA